ncbi:MAG: HD domain-containing protein [Actinobacteria bacterium]|nr:HD domain-containing protein [Actinomycetota bacterium]
MRVPGPQRVALIVALTVVAVGGLILLSNGAAPGPWARVVATSLCSLGSLGVVWMGLRGRLAEVAVIGVVLLLVPLFDLVAALGSLGSPPTPQGAAFADTLAVPLAAAAGGPLLLPDTWLRAVVSRRWRLWTAVWVGAGLSLATLLAHTAIRPPLPPTWFVIAGAMAGSVVFACIGRRHLLLYQVGRQWVSLLVGVTFVTVAVIGVVGHGVGVPSHLALAAVVTDVALSFAAIVGMAVMARRLRHIPDVLAPLVARDPLVVLALGLDPVVEEFVGRVGRKDAGTRDHIVRVGELAMRVAVRAGIRGRQLRALGIGALLHDVGKLVVPDEVLRKPGALTSEEYEIVKRHASAGDELLTGSPAAMPSTP